MRYANMSNSLLGLLGLDSNTAPQVPEKETSFTSAFDSISKAVEDKFSQLTQDRPNVSEQKQPQENLKLTDVLNAVAQSDFVKDLSPKQESEQVDPQTAENDELNANYLNNLKSIYGEADKDALVDKMLQRKDVQGLEDVLGKEVANNYLKDTSLLNQEAVDKGVDYKNIDNYSWKDAGQDALVTGVNTLYSIAEIPFMVEDLKNLSIGKAAGLIGLDSVSDFYSKAMTMPTIHKGSTFLESLHSKGYDSSKKISQDTLKKYTENNKKEYETNINNGMNEYLAKGIQFGSDFLAAGSQALSNNITLTDLTVSNTVQFLTGAKLAKITASLAKTAVPSILAKQGIAATEENIAKYIASEAGQQMLNKVTTRTATTVFGSGEGISAYDSISKDINNRTDADLQKLDPQYAAYRKDGMSEKDAKDARITESSYLAVISAGALGIATSKLSGAGEHFGSLGVKEIVKPNQLVQGLRGMGTGSLENAIQGVTTTTSANAGIKYNIDSSKDLLEGAAEQSALGAVGGGLAGGMVSSPELVRSGIANTVKGTADIITKGTKYVTARKSAKNAEEIATANKSDADKLNEVSVNSDTLTNTKPVNTEDNPTFIDDIVKDSGNTLQKEDVSAISEIAHKIVSQVKDNGNNIKSDIGIMDNDKVIPLENVLHKDSAVLKEFKDNSKENYLAENGLGNFLNKSIEILNDKTTKYSPEDKTELAQYVKSTIDNSKSFAVEMYSAMVNPEVPNESKLQIADAIVRSENILTKSPLLNKAQAIADVYVTDTNAASAKATYEGKLDNYIKNTDPESLVPVMYNILADKSLSTSDKSNLFKSIKNMDNVPENVQQILDLYNNLDTDNISKNYGKVRDNIFNTSRDGFKSVSEHIDDISKAALSGSKYALDSAKGKFNYFNKYMQEKATNFENAYNSIEDGQPVTAVKQDGSPYLDGSGKPIKIREDASSRKLIDLVKQDANLLNEVAKPINEIKANKAEKASKPVAENTETKIEAPLADTVTKEKTPVQKNVEDISNKVDEITKTKPEPVKTETEEVTPKVQEETKTEPKTEIKNDTVEPVTKEAPANSVAKRLLETVTPQRTKISEKYKNADARTKEILTDNLVTKAYEPVQENLSKFQQNPEIIDALSDTETPTSYVKDLFGIPDNINSGTLENVKTALNKSLSMFQDSIYKNSANAVKSGFSKDGIFHWDKKPSLYFVETVRNPDTNKVVKLQYADSYVKALSVESVRFLGEEVAFLTSDADALTNYFNSADDSETTIPTYLDASTVSKNIGSNVLNILGLSKKKSLDIGENLLNNLALSVGTDVLNTLISNDLLQKVEVVNPVDGKKHNLLIKHPSLKTDLDSNNTHHTLSHKDLTTLNAILPLMESVLTPATDTKNGIVFNSSKQLKSNSTFKKSPTKVPTEIKQFADDFSNIPFRVNKKFDNLLNIFSDEQIKAIGGYVDIDSVPAISKETVAGINNTTEDALMRLKSAKQQAEMQGADFANSDIAIGLNIVSNGRAMYKSNTLNPQGYKLHRMLLSRGEGEKINLNNREELNSYLVTLAQNFGVKTHLKGIDNSIADLNTILDNPQVSSAIEALTRNHLGEQISEEDKANVINAVKSVGNGYIAFNALNDYAAMNAEIQKGNSEHTANVYYELDGISHGSSTAYIQFSLRQNQQSVDMLNKVGIVVDPTADTKTYSDVVSKTDNFADLYQTVSNTITGNLADILNRAYQNPDLTSTEKASIDNYKKLLNFINTFDNSAKFDIQTTTNEFGFPEVSIKGSRNFGKQPTTVLGAYGGGDTAVSSYGSGDIVKGFRENYGKAFDSLIKAVKDKNNSAIKEHKDSLDKMIRIVGSVMNLPSNLPPESSRKLSFYKDFSINTKTLKNSLIKLMKEKILLKDLPENTTYLSTVSNSVNSVLTDVRTTGQMMTSISGVLGLITKHEYRKAYNEKLNELRDSGKLSNFESLPENVARQVLNDTLAKTAPIIKLGDSVRLEAGKPVEGLSLFKSGFVPVDGILNQTPENKSVLGRTEAVTVDPENKSKYIQSVQSQTEVLGDTGVLAITNGIQSLEALLQARVYKDLKQSNPELANKYQDNFDGFDTMIKDLPTYGHAINENFRKIQLENSPSENLYNRFKDVLSNLNIKTASDLNNYLNSVVKETLQRGDRQTLDNIGISINTFTEQNTDALIAKDGLSKAIINVTSLLNNSIVKSKEAKAILLSNDKTLVSNFASPFGESMPNRSKETVATTSPVLNQKEVLLNQQPKIEPVTKPEIINDKPVISNESLITKPIKSLESTSYKVYDPKSLIKMLKKDGSGNSLINSDYFKNIMSLISRKIDADTQIHIGTTDNLLKHIKENYRGNFENINFNFNGISLGKDVYIKSDKASPEIIMHELMHNAINNHLYNALYTKQSNEVNSSVRSLLQSVDDVVQANLNGDSRLSQLVSTLNSYNTLSGKDRTFAKISELISYTLTNPDVLNATQETKSSFKDRTYAAFRKFVDKILGILGVSNPKMKESVFNNVFANTHVVASKTKLNTNYLDRTSIENYHNSVNEFSQRSYEDIFNNTKDTKSSPEHINYMQNTYNKLFNSVKTAIESRKADNNISTFDDVMFKHELENPETLNTINKLSANGFSFTPKEKLLFNALHTVFEYGVTSPKFELLTHNFTKLYNSAKEQLTPKDLIQSNEPVSLGNSRYNALFNDAATGDSGSTKLANFIALYGSSEMFKNKLDSINFKGESSNLFNTFFSNVSDFIGGLPVNKILGRRVQSTIDKLSYIDSKSRNDLMAFVDKAEISFDNLINESDKKLSIEAQKLRDNLYNLTKDSNSKLLSGSVLLSDLAIGKNNPDDITTAFHRLLNASKSDSSQRLGTFGELLNEFMGVTEHNKDLTQMLAKNKFMQDQHRNSILSNVPKAIDNLFTKPLTEKQSVSLKHSILDTDSSIIFENFQNLGHLEDIYRDPNVLSKEVVNLESDIINSISNPKIQNFVLNQVDGLGKLMATGLSGLPNQAPNINILRNMVNKITGETLSPATVKMLDMLASLRAVEYSDKDSNLEVADLIKNEPKAIKALSNIITETRNAEYSKINANISGISLKGATPAITDPSRSVIIAENSKRNELANKGYTIGSPVEKAHYDINTPELNYYYADNLYNPVWVSGVMSTARDTISGSYVGSSSINNSHFLESYASSDAVKAIAQASNKDFENQFNTRLKPDSDVNHPVPVYNADGTIKSYSQTLNKQEYNIRTNSNQSIQDNIATWQARIYLEAFSDLANTNLVKLLKDNYVSDVKSGEIDSYVEVTPDSKDKYIKEVYSMIPPKMRAEIKKQFPSGVLRVRRTDFNNALGMREWSIKEVFDKPEHERSMLESGLAQISELMFGKQAEYKLGIGTRYLKAYAKKAKNFILVKNLAVLTANVVSNIAQARAYGITMTDLVKDYNSSYNYAREYHKLNGELIRLESDKVAYSDVPSKVKDINNRITEINELLMRNPAKYLIEKGMLPTVLTEDTPNSKYELGYNLFKSLENQIAKLPKGVNTAVSNLAMMENSATYKTLNTLNQYSDFMARYSLFKQLTERNENKLTPEQATDLIQDEFIDYNLLPSRTRQYLDTVGLTWFLNYRIRSQKIILRMMRKSPLRFLGQVGLAGAGVPTILDTNMATGNNTAPFGLFNGVRYINNSAPLNYFDLDNLTRIGK